MSLKVFLLWLISAYASDFLTLVTDIDRIQKDCEITCHVNPDAFGRILLMVDGEVPGYRVAPYCGKDDLRLYGNPIGFGGKFSIFGGFALYLCDVKSTLRTALEDEICAFHKAGTSRSLHVVYRGASLDHGVALAEGQTLEFFFYDIYDGNDMSYGNFVGVFSPTAVHDEFWKFTVDTKRSSYSLNIRDNPGKIHLAGLGHNLVSYVYPDVNDVPSDYVDPLILSVGVFGTLKSHHFVHSCMKEKPAGHCIHSSSKTFTKGGSDMLTMALPNDMETYYFEYSVFEFSVSYDRGAYGRVIFKTSVVKKSMIEIFQKRVFFSNEVADGMFVATNLMKCHATLETCMNGGKKAFKLTLYGYTKPQQVQKLIVHGGDTVVKVEDKDCQEQNSQCIVTAELFAYRNTQMWIEGIKDTHNGVINPDENYQAMIFQDITLVIEPAE